MKRILALLLFASTAMAQTEWLPIAIPQAYWSNPTKKQEIKDAISEFANGASWESIKQTATWSTVTNVVGNPSIGVPAGSDWYIGCNAKENWFGKRSDGLTQYKITYNTNNLPTNCVIITLSQDLDAKAAQLASYTNILLVGEWTLTPADKFNEWGIYNESVEP